MTRHEVLLMLEENHHGFFGQDFIDKVNAAFDLKLKGQTYEADGDTNPKGLTLADGGKSAVGLAAFDLAPMICCALNVPFQCTIWRGFQVRACCNALRDAGKC